MVKLIEIFIQFVFTLVPTYALYKLFGDIGAIAFLSFAIAAHQYHIGHLYNLIKDH